jgi:ABC-type Fe3+-hydroxamate transport system substrate-binding protein
MKKLILLWSAAALLAPLSFAVEAVSAVHGTISKIDAGAKTIVVKTGDGAEHTFRFVANTAVYGTEAGAKDAFHGLKEGSEVVAHYTAKGTENTAVEVDKVGKGGLKAVDGTVSDIKSGGKELVVKSADGTEQAFQMADHAAAETGKGAQKSAKVTVYYTESAGKKIAHFFEKR